MDNDKQISRSMDQSRDFFLDQPLKDDTKTVHLYEIEEEYSKTKKNGTPFVWIISLVFLVFALLGSLLLTWIIDEGTKRTTVIVDQFEEIKLKEILDTAKKNQKLLSSSQRDLVDLQTTQERLLQESAQASEREIELMEQQVSASQRSFRRQGILNSQAKRDQAIKSEYARLLAEKQLEIAERQKAVDEYDTRITELEKKNQEVLNNQNLLFEREKQVLNEYWESKIKTETESLTRELAAEKDSHQKVTAQMRRNHQNELARTILRFNPVIAAEENLEPLMASGHKAALSLPVYSELLDREKVLSSSEHSQLLSQISAWEKLNERVHSIPYINSVPGLLGGLSRSVQSQVLSLRDVLAKTSELVADKNRIIGSQKALLNSYQFALEAWARTHREGGFVIDSQNPEKLLVSVQAIYGVKPGQKAFIFRNDDQEIAKIEFVATDSEYYARVLELSDPATGILPFDKILLNLDAPAAENAPLVEPTPHGEE